MNIFELVDYIGDFVVVFLVVNAVCEESLNVSQPVTTTFKVYMRPLNT